MLTEELIVPPVQIAAISWPPASLGTLRHPPVGALQHVAKQRWVIVTTPSADHGHRKRSRSSRSGAKRYAQSIAPKDSQLAAFATST
jgi:hypothetical protein